MRDSSCLTELRTVGRCHVDLQQRRLELVEPESQALQPLAFVSEAAGAASGQSSTTTYIGWRAPELLSSLLRWAGVGHCHRFAPAG